METLENNILAVLTEKGMTKKALCRETGINKGSLHKIINGQDVRLSTAKKVGEALGCTIADLWNV